MICANLCARRRKLRKLPSNMIPTVIRSRILPRLRPMFLYVGISHKRISKSKTMSRMGSANLARARRYS